MATAIIQARLKSTRLPNKVLMDIDGRSLLGRVIDTVRPTIPDIIIATPDKLIAEFAVREGCLAYIGSENDVLDRYYQAAKHYGVKDIVRVTSDNPLIEAEMLRKVITLYETGEYDYVSNWLNNERTFPYGDDCEIFSYNALETAHNEAGDPYEREHVTPYLYRHPEKFRLGLVKDSIDRSNLRWTVDTQEDLDHIRNLFARQIAKIY